MYFLRCLSKWREFHVFFYSSIYGFLSFEQIDRFTIQSTFVSGKSHRSRIYDTRNRFSVSDLLFLAHLCVCIMHNGAHHRISISSLCTRRRRAFVSSRRERPYFFPFAKPQRFSLAPNRHRHRQRLQEGDEGDDTCAKVKMYGSASTWVDSPTCNILVKEILITRYVIGGRT